MTNSYIHQRLFCILIVSYSTRALRKMSEKVVLPVIDWLLIGLDKTRLLKHLQKYYVPHDEEKKT